MILSNEPGYYKTGAYGIRIENLELVIGAEIAGGERPMLGFETLTLAPIDRRLIDVAMLSEAELAWLDAYHARVRREVRPHVDEATKCGSTPPPRRFAPGAKTVMPGLVPTRFTHIQSHQPCSSWGGQRRACAVPTVRQLVGTLRFAHPTRLFRHGRDIGERKRRRPSDGYARP